MVLKIDTRLHLEAYRSESNTDPALHTVLVLCGGRGHSTQFMHDAVAAHPRFSMIADDIKGYSEARIFQAIAQEFYYGLQTQTVIRTDEQANNSLLGRLSIIVEDESTNCGANAACTRAILKKHGVHSPLRITIAQDPTMSRRTKASFEKVYEHDNYYPEILSWPTFVPHVKVSSSTGKDEPFDYDIESLTAEQVLGLWDRQRFMSLLVGEIPRLRDDADGYGPKGKGFISHVDIPEAVERAWQILSHHVQPRAAVDAQT